MKVLFLHYGYPGQFRALAPALAARGDDVRTLTDLAELSEPQPGVSVIGYKTTRTRSPAIHPWLTTFEQQVIRGEACFEAARQLSAGGFNPDLVIAHPSWGDSLFIKDAWPDARLALYCEQYHHLADAEFDPEFTSNNPASRSLIRLNNLVYETHFEEAAGAIAPTRYQADLFPERFRPKIEVIHDGVDTALVAPKDIRLQLSDSLTLTRADEVVTFVNRQFEPLRGCHIFLRALPEMLKRRPNAHFLLIGAENSQGYGYAPPDGRSWKRRFVEEVRPRIAEADWARVHFISQLPYASFIGLLQLSSVHVYLTHPAVLSWSLIEAMSAGCAIVGSDTAPVREVVEHDRTGRLVDFFDIDGLAREVCGLLADPAARQRLGAAARAQAVSQYDLKSVCLPKQIAWVDRLAGGADV